MIKLLERWHKIAPEECKAINTQFVGYCYIVGYYEFWQAETGNFTADHDGNMVSGQPAYDWLLGCVIRAIEAEGSKFWHITTNGKTSKTWIAKNTVLYSGNGITETLLTAYLEYLEGNK